jgi:hypothetical protein
MGGPDDGALCLFGQMRTYDRCFQYLNEYLLNPLDPDIFIHTWQDPGGTWKEGLDSTADDSIITYDRLEEHYEPTNMVIEEFKEQYYHRLNGIEIPEDIKSLPGYAKSILPSFYKINKSIELKCKHEEDLGEVYDLVILLRPDIAIGEPIPDKVLQTPEYLWTRPTKPYYYDDQFIISKSKNIDYFGSIWKKLEGYLQVGLGPNYGEYGEIGIDNHNQMNIGNPERLIHYHLEQTEIDTETFLVRSHILRFDDKQPFFEKSLPKRLWQLFIDGGVEGARDYPYTDLEGAVCVLRNDGVFQLMIKTGRKIFNI